MSSEDSGDPIISITLPADVGKWIEEEASRRDVSQDALCRQLLTAVHRVSTDGDYADELDGLRTDLDTQREDFFELLEDVRRRVIQVKREADAKAPADHYHEAYATVGDLEGLTVDHETLEETVHDGFENFEEILDHLLEEKETLEDRSTILATAVLDLRESRNQLRERDRRRAEAERLKLAANRSGIRTATCDACGSSVDLALLTEPECPHCARSVADVERKTSIFGSHSLVTGDPPALEGRVDREPTHDGGDVFDAVATEATGADHDLTDPSTEPGDGTK